MAFKYILAICFVLSAVSASSLWGGVWAPPADSPNPWVAGGGINPWIPPWVANAPWFPQWTPCTTIGPSCVDCTTRRICTKIGGIQRACTDPTLPYCNLGLCSATPSDECQPTTTSAPVVNA